MPVLLDHLALNLTGTPSVQGVQIPDSATWVRVELVRCTASTPSLWAAVGTTVRCNIELDGALFGGFNSRGGVHTLSAGGELPVTSVTYPLPMTTGRDLEVTVIRLSLAEALVTELTIETD